MKYTTNEQSLIKWLLRGEAEHCRKQIERIDLSDKLVKTYRLRLECAKSALEKMTSADLTDTEEATECLS